MDKKKRMRAKEQKAPARTSKGNVLLSSVKGRTRITAAKSNKPFRSSVSRPSKPSRPIRPSRAVRDEESVMEEENLNNRQAESEENREAASAALPASGAGAGALGGFGGIEGMISMMGKANQMIRLFQQMGPIFKLFGMFGGGGAKVSTASVRLNRKRASVKKAGGKEVSTAGRNRVAAKPRAKR